MDDIQQGFAQQAAAEEQATQERLDAEAAMSVPATPEVEEQAQPEAQQQPDQVTQLMQGAQDFVAGLLGQDQEQRQEARAEGQQQQQETQAKFDEQDNIAAETTRAVAGGLAGAVEGVGETASLIKDTVTGEAFKDGYEAADWDLGITENKTQVGKFARTMVSMLTVMRGAGAAGVGVGGGASAASRLGTEAVRGAIADLIVSQDDENLSNMLADMGMPHIAALAVDDNDGPWSARIKNIVEGGVFGVAVDGVGELIGAIAKGRAAVKAGKSQEEAVNAVIKAVEPKPTRTPLKLSDSEMTKVTQKLPNGSEVGWYYQPEDVLGGAFKSYDVSWDMLGGGKIDGGGKSMVSEFRKQAKDMPPGTVLSAQPLADDELGSGAIKRSAAQERAMAKNKAADDAARLKQAEELWIEENADQFPMEFADGTGYATAKEAWDDLDDSAKDNRLERFETEGKIEKGHATGVSNVRGNVYSRMGFGDVDPYHGTQFGVVGADGKVRPINLTLKSENRAAEQKLLQAAIDEARQVEGVRPGSLDRADAQKEFGSSPDSPALYEPSDAASRTTSHDPNTALISQEKAGDLPQTSASPVLTDAAFEKITSGRAVQGMTDDAIAGLKSVVAETASKIDGEALAKELGQSWDETTVKAIRAVHDFIGADTPEDALKALDSVTFIDEAGNQVANREGVVALKTLIKDTAYQIQELSANIMDAANTGADATRQFEMLGERLRGLLRMHKTSSVHYGSGLNAFKIGGLGGNGGAGELAKAIADNDKFVNNMIDLARKGDPKSINDLKNAANGLVLAGGDPGKQLSFWQLVRKVGTQEAMKSMYNSMLSSPLTHVRNTIGNAMAAGLRPIELAIGRGMNGDIQGAKAAMGAFHSFGESISEAFAMGGAAWKNGAPAGGKYVDQTAEMAKQLDQLRATANTNGEKAGVFFLTKLHDLNNNPWASYPTRALTAGDEMFKTLIARMEMKRQVFDESFASTGDLMFDPDLYAKKLEEKLGRNGEIIDKQLSEVATDATFQQELKGTMKRFDEFTKSHPALTYLMPFVRTPHNLLVYAGTHTPGINRFLDEYKAVMAGTDENAKAIMRGREALGWMTVTSGIGLAASGVMTGNGPVDPQKRKAWLKTHQPQSIKVGNKWVSYQSVEPLNTIFAAVVDLVEFAKAGDAAAYDRNAGQLAYSIAAATFNKSYFQGLQTAVNTLNPSNLAKEGWIERDALKALNSFIPLSGARRQLAKALEPTMLEARNEFDAALNTAVPGYANVMGIEKIDIFTGKDMETENTNFLNWFLPFKITDVETDPVLTNIADKGIDINATLESANGIELTAEERIAIDKLTAETGLHKKLKEHFAKKWFKEDYENWVNTDANSRIKIEGSLWYSETIKIIQDARRTAVDYYRENNTEFDARYRAAQLQKYKAKQGDYTLPQEVQDLLNY